MFETDEFRRRITEVVSSEAARRGLEKYQTSVPDYLQRLALSNERVLMEREMQKTAGRRGMYEAIESARVLAEEASRYALAEKRDTLTLSDMQRAYQAKFCQVWPFCQ